MGGAGDSFRVYDAITDLRIAEKKISNMKETIETLESKIRCMQTELSWITKYLVEHDKNLTLGNPNHPSLGMRETHW